jgi:H+/Cl- antiporter ClcA
VLPWFLYHLVFSHSHPYTLTSLSISPGAPFLSTFCACVSAFLCCCVETARVHEGRRQRWTPQRARIAALFLLVFFCLFPPPPSLPASPARTASAAPSK